MTLLIPSQSEVLSRALARIANPGRRPPVVVFDLDGTLYDSRHRTLRILAEFAEATREEAPDLAGALEALGPGDLSYLLADTLHGCGVTSAEHVQAVTRFWRERFFTEPYLQYDQRVPGAVDFVRTCHQMGATVVYLASRDAMGTLGATASALYAHGFPMAVAGVEMVLEPDPTFSDEAFKRVALPSLARIGEIAAVFDNEPANCNVALRLYPEAAVVRVDTQRVPGSPELEPGVDTVRDLTRR